MKLYFKYYNSDFWQDLQLDFESLLDLKNFIKSKKPHLKILIIGDEMLVLNTLDEERIVEVYTLLNEEEADEMEKNQSIR